MSFVTIYASFHNNICGIQIPAPHAIHPISTNCAIQHHNFKSIIDSKHYISSKKAVSLMFKKVPPILKSAT